MRPRTGLLHVAAWLAAALMILAVAAPVAARPTRECGNDKFELMTMEEFRDLSLSLGVPSVFLFSDAGRRARNGTTRTAIHSYASRTSPTPQGIWAAGSGT